MSFQLFAFRKGFAHLFADSQVFVVERIKYNGSHFCRVHFAVLVKHTLVCADVYDFSSQDARVRIVVFYLALQRNGKFVDKRGVDKSRLRGMETGPLKLVGNFISGYESHIIAGCHVRRVGHAYRKRTGFQQVLHCLVACAQTQADFVHFADAAPCRVHRVRSSVLIVCGNDEYRLGIA